MAKWIASYDIRAYIYAVSSPLYRSLNRRTFYIRQIKIYTILRIAMECLLRMIRRIGSNRKSLTCQDLQPLRIATGIVTKNYEVSYKQKTPKKHDQILFFSEQRDSSLLRYIRLR